MSGRLTTPLEKWRRGFDYRRILLIGLAVIGLVAALFLTVSIATTASTSLCGGVCHVTNPQYQSWNRSSHSRVPCYSCHVGRSPLDWARHVAVDKPRHVLNMFRFSDSRPINGNSAAAAGIPNDRCVNCHSRVPGEPTNDRGRRYRRRHREHTAAGVRCTDCHNRIAHTGAERYAPLIKDDPSFRYKDFGTMRTGCWRCHSTLLSVRKDNLLDELGLTVFPPTACRTCHRRIPKPTHGRLDHANSYSDSWVDHRHGRLARRNYDACTPCHSRKASGPNHEVSDCTECHNGITMPHNIGAAKRYYDAQAAMPEWSREHTEFGASADACRLCHTASDNQDVCAQCHHRDHLLGTDTSLTPWPESHQLISNEEAPECQKCHMVEFCAYCHAQGKLPPPGQYFYKLSDR